LLPLGEFVLGKKLVKSAKPTNTISLIRDQSILNWQMICNG
jgi:hypothetical protein